MFCNNCGKENADGIKFCVNCGTPLNQTAAPKAPSKNTSMTSIGAILTPGRKKGIVAIFALVMVIIAAVNIISVYRGIFDVTVRDEEQEANCIDVFNSIYETNGYMYYTCYGSGTRGLYRVNKSNKDVKKLTNKNLHILVAASNYIICADNAENCWYKVTDKTGELDILGDFYGNSSIIRGKYNYTVFGDGQIRKSLNCNDSNFTSLDLSTSHSGQHSDGVKAYKNYIYMILYDNSSEDRELVRVSMKNGKEESLGSGIDEFTFSGNYIIYQTSDNIFGKMNLDGSNQSEYIDIEPTPASFFCTNGYVYYMDGWDLCRFDVESGTKEELNGDVPSRITGVSGGLAYLDENELHLLDYSGNEIDVLRP